MKKLIEVTFKLPMEFPDDWSDDLIEFHLNDSSWCCSNYINLLKKYDEEYGCLCGITTSKILDNLGE